MLLLDRIANRNAKRIKQITRKNINDAKAVIYKLQTIFNDNTNSKLVVRQKISFYSKLVKTENNKNQ